MKNPFEFGRALTSTELVDREEELAEVTAALLGSSKLFLIGPRRYGKTSILRAAELEATHSGAVVLRYDAESFPTLASLAERLLADATRKLTPTIEKAGAALRDFFVRLRPQASIDPQTGEWSVSLTIEDDSKQIPLLVDVIDGIERLAARAKVPVAIIFDEFQKIVEVGGADAEAQLRAAVQHHKQLAYVFAGSKTRLLADMTSDPNRPFYKLGNVRFLGPIPRVEFASFLERGFIAGGIAVQPGATDAILDAAEDVPYNIQLLAHACWEACRESLGKVKSGRHPAALTPGLVERTRDVIAQRSDPIYTQLWTRLSSFQQRALLALLREGGVGLATNAVARRYRLSIPALAKSLKLLERKSIIREEQTLGNTRLRLEDPFFGAWIALVIPA